MYQPAPLEMLGNIALALLVGVHGGMRPITGRSFVALTAAVTDAALIGPVMLFAMSAKTWTATQAFSTWERVAALACLSPEASRASISFLYCAMPAICVAVIGGNGEESRAVCISG